MYVAIYCRTSTANQEKGMEAQRRALVEFCKSKGIENYKVFEDFGVSGSKSSRPALNEMMKKVNEGSVASVIVYSFSRFARSTKHLLSALELFREKKVGFVSITENVDTSSPMGRAFFTIISAISQLERELISERVKNGLKNARAKGSKLGRPKQRNTELIVSLRSQGYTYKQIRSLLGVGHGTITSAIKESDSKESSEE